MLDLPTGARGRLLALGLTLCAASLLWFAVVSPLLGWHGEQAERLAQQRTLLARTTEVAAGVPALRRALAALATEQPARNQMLPGSTDALAGAALEERLQELAATTAAPITSAEVLPATEMGPIRRIGVRVAVQATMANVIRLLAAMAAAQPRMLVDELDMRSQFLAANPREPAVRASFVAYGFRAGTAEGTTRQDRTGQGGTE